MIHDQRSIIFKSKYSLCTCTVEFCPLLQVEFVVHDTAKLSVRNNY